MELYENFKPRCSMEKAYTIGYEQAPYDIALIAKECYYNAFSKCNSNEFMHKQNVAHMSVYMLGFLSVARAIRERKHLQQALRLAAFYFAVGSFLHNAPLLPLSLRISNRILPTPAIFQRLQNYNLYIIILVCAHKSIGFYGFLLCLLLLFFLSIAEYLLTKKT